MRIMRFLYRGAGSFSGVGAAVGTLFFAAALTPSLIPRSYVMQGVLAGGCLAAGYGLGVLGRWLWAYLELPEPGGRVRRTANAVIAACCIAIAVAFLWRGRLYVVRDVLGHWCERRSWWTSHAARLVHGEGAESAAGPGSAADTGSGEGAVTGGVRVAELAQEREVWRVCASRGRSYAEGVFDLCREPAGSSPSRDPVAVSDVWRLVHVAD